ncbi:MAG TPA: hypothetical protein VIF15_21015 [Polyangiaceae bacterium]
MTIFPNARTTAGLVVRASTALGLTQQGLADLVSGSLRSSQRWTAAQAVPSAEQLRTLAVAVHAHDAGLAREIAAEAGTTLEALGLMSLHPPPGPPPPSTPPALVPLLVESVVAAAAEALDASPRVMRPALLAALERAEQAGLTLADVLAVLSAPAAGLAATPAAPATPATAARPSGATKTTRG